jgi:hypothetical protein
MKMSLKGLLAKDKAQSQIRILIKVEYLETIVRTMEDL